MINRNLQIPQIRVMMRMRIMMEMIQEMMEILAKWNLLNARSINLNPSVEFRI